MYTLNSLGGRVMCSPDIIKSASYSFTGGSSASTGGTAESGKPLCFVTWGNSINAQVGLPIMYSLSTNPRASPSVPMSLCDCAVDQSDSSQAYCNGETGPNIGECHALVLPLLLLLVCDNPLQFACLL